jgi:hypothetical protein
VAHQTEEQQQATLQRSFAIAANVYAMRLQLSKFTLDREGSHAAYEVALAHHQAWMAMSGLIAPGSA